MRYLFLGLMALLLGACSLAPTTSKVVRFDHPPSEADLGILQTRVLQATGEKARWLPLEPGAYRLSSYALPPDESLNYLFNHQGVFRALAPDGQVLLTAGQVAEMLAKATEDGRTVFHFALTHEGVDHLAAFAQANPDKTLRFVLDDELLAEVPIGGLVQAGKIQLTLARPPAQAGLTAVVLRTGSLSAPIKLRSIAPGEAANA
ncbi:preprotein translocase subunit SecD family protein [Chitinimonas naiadis]